MAADSVHVSRVQDVVFSAGDVGQFSQLDDSLSLPSVTQLPLFME